MELGDRVDDAGVAIARLQEQLRALDPVAQVAGCSEQEVSDAERSLGLTFPAMYRAFLLRLGWSPGPLFRGTDVAAASELVDLLSEAQELLQESGAEFTLPTGAVVIAMHQGYSFFYFVAGDVFDVPVHLFVEGQPGPRQVASSLSEFFQAEVATIRLAKERIAERGRA